MARAGRASPTGAEVSPRSLASVGERRPPPVGALGEPLARLTVAGQIAGPITLPGLAVDSRPALTSSSCSDRMSILHSATPNGSPLGAHRL